MIKLVLWLARAAKNPGWEQGRGGPAAVGGRAPPDDGLLRNRSFGMRPSAPRPGRRRMAGVGVLCTEMTEVCLSSAEKPFEIALPGSEGS